MTFAQLLAAIWLAYGAWLFGSAIAATHRAHKKLGRIPKPEELEVEVSVAPWLLLGALMALVVLL